MEDITPIGEILPNRFQQHNATTSLIDLNERNWTDHRRQQRHYVQTILNNLPDPVKYKPRSIIGRQNKQDLLTTCNEKAGQYGSDFNLTSTRIIHPKTTNHAIIIPYRDRKYHLGQFKKYMSSYLQHHYGHTGHTFTLYVIEQDDDEPFMRGLLLNAGLDHVELDVNCVSIHDVDLVPNFFSKTLYHDCDFPTQMFHSAQTFAWKVPYQNFFGAVVGMHRKHWAVVNGMGNQFKGWGAEDDDLWLRVIHRALVADCKHPFPRRPKGADGHFMAISQGKEHHHERNLTGEKNILYNRNVEIYKKPMWSGVSNSMTDGWIHAKYNVTSHATEAVEDFPGFEAIHHIKIFPMTEFLNVNKFRRNITTRLPATRNQTRQIMKKSNIRLVPKARDQMKKSNIRYAPKKLKSNWWSNLLMR
jgi:hypothetical protein